MIRITAYSLGALCLMMAACQTTRMPIPAGLSEHWIVEGRQGWRIRENLRLGPYEAVEVDRSWTRERARDVPGFESSDSEQSYSFTLTEGNVAQWQVRCRTALTQRTVRTPVADVDFRNRTVLDCALTGADESETWLLTLGESREAPLEGRLHKEDDTFAVVGTTALAGGVAGMETSGYHVTHDGRPVAAVEVINNGAVALAPNLAPSSRSLLAATAAALLLLDELRGILEE